MVNSSEHKLRLATVFGWGSRSGYKTRLFTAMHFITSAKSMVAIPKVVLEKHMYIATARVWSLQMIHTCTELELDGHWRHMH